MASNESTEQFISVNNGFAPTLYKEYLKYNKENFIFSPLSTTTILALLESGGKDETAEEIRNVLHLPEKTEQEEAEKIGNFLCDLKLAELQSANKLYVKDNVPIKEEFDVNASLIYQSKTENIDFANNEGAAEKINTWVKEETNNKVQNLVKADSLSESTKGIIVNVSYLKSEWDSKFHIDDTKEADFYLSGDNVVKVDTMHFKPYYVRSNDPRLYYHRLLCITDVHIRQNHWFLKNEELKATFVKFDLEGKETAMVIVLPDDKEGLVALENQIDKVLTHREFTRTGRIDVNIALPKFKIDTETDLKELLSRIGVDAIFSEETADLSKIAGDRGDLIINKIIQKTFIDVNEGGVETGDPIPFEKNAVSMEERDEPPAKEFNVDHPFIFYITIKEAIIFAGRVTNPLL